MTDTPPHVAGQLHHVEINVSNLARSRQFWDSLLADLGYRRYQEWEQGVSWKLGATYIVFVQTEEAYVEPSYHRRRPTPNALSVIDLRRSPTSTTRGAGITSVPVAKGSCSVAVLNLDMLKT